MKVKLGVLLMSLGVALMLAAGGWNLYMNTEASRAENEAAEALPDVLAAIRQEAEAPVPAPSEEMPSPSPTVVSTHEPVLTGEVTPSPSPEPALQVVYAQNKPYVGTLQIPALGLTLPIQAEWSYAKMKHTPCHYSGTPEGKNLVLIAHNYKGHFGRLKELPSGSEIIFTDAKGNTYLYETDVLETLAPNQNGYLVAGDWALSLSTCTVGGRQREILRCNLKALP